MMLDALSSRRRIVFKGGRMDTNFEVYVCSVKAKYERMTGANFVEDFGSHSLIDLKKNFESQVSMDEAVRLFLNKEKRSACVCESGCEN